MTGSGPGLARFSSLSKPPPTCSLLMYTKVPDALLLTEIAVAWTGLGRHRASGAATSTACQRWRVPRETLQGEAVCSGATVRVARPTRPQPRMATDCATCVSTRIVAKALAGQLVGQTTCEQDATPSASPPK